MSEVSGGSGWWLASDGRWYPPHLRPGRPTEVPFADLPRLGPVPPSAAVAPAVATTGAAPAGTLDAPHRAGDVVGPGRRRRRVRPGAVALGVVVASAALVVGARGAGWIAGGTAGTNGSTPTVPAGPAGRAAAIGLRSADLGPGFTATGTVDPVATHAVPGPCTPLSGGPWTAYRSSPYFTASSGDLTVTSDVVLMPTAGDARAALATIDAPSYGTTCFLPSTDASVTSALATAGASCGLSLEGPGIVHLDLPTAEGPLTGYHYSADLLCARTGRSEPYTMDIVDQVVGTVFLQARFRSIGSPPSSTFEERVMRAMAIRAAGATH